MTTKRPAIYYEYDLYFERPKSIIISHSSSDIALVRHQVDDKFDLAMHFDMEGQVIIQPWLVYLSYIGYTQDNYLVTIVDIYIEISYIDGNI